VSETVFQRYLSLVDDQGAFLAACERPLPLVVWANPLAMDPAVVEAALFSAFPDAEPVSWRPHTWRLPPEAKVGNWPMHVVGGLYVQEEAAAFAGDVVDAQPGERILDLCAAPGGKTAQMAIAMGDRGTIVANDRRIGRLASLRRTVGRLGLTSVTVTCHDGIRFPQETLFDRVLVDAPCTCEGTARKSGRRSRNPDERYRNTVVQIQKALLRRALSVTKPGGRVVYSTCTFAPEENEYVLDAIDPSLASIEPIAPMGLTVAPGLCEWRGRYLRPDIRHAARVWPHQNDTGGFFVACLRRL